MKISNSVIAVYSTANVLIDTLTSKQYTPATSGSMSLSYSIRSSGTDVRGLSDVDALVYDLSLVNDDITRAAVDILHLKVNCGNKPLILIGSRQALEVALASPRIKPEIAHTLAKPMTGGQLRFVSEAVIVKHELSHLPITKGRFSTSARVGAGLVVVAGLALAVGSLWTFSNSAIQTDQNSLQVESLINPRVASVQDAPNRESEKVQQRVSIDSLTTLVSLATQEGRLAFPEKDNALAYLDQILEIDGYHQTAYQGRQETLKVLDGSLAVMMSERDYVQAEKLLGVLLNAEPFNDEYRRIDLALRGNNGSAAKPNVIDASAAIDIVSVPIEAAKEPIEVARAPVEIARVPVDVIKAPEPLPVSTESRFLEIENLVANQVDTPAKVAPTEEQKTDYTPAVVVKRAAAVYPRKAQEREIQGWVKIGYQIDIDGEVVNAHVIAASPEKIFDNAGIKAIKKWRFEPMKNSLTGEPLISSLNLTTFNFNLNEAGSLASKKSRSKKVMADDVAKLK